MLVADHLRPAAINAGVILKPGQRFGFHNFWHSLSSLLITGQKSDVRTTQDILRHTSSATTLDLYTQSPMAQRITAQESVLAAILKPTRKRSLRTLRNVSRARLRRGRYASVLQWTSDWRTIMLVESDANDRDSAD